MMSSSLPPDPYAALGVSRDASLAAIKSAYRKLVLVTHPDKVQDESLRAQKQDEFQKIQHAYETLSDEEKRQEYEELVKKARAKKEAMAAAEFTSRSGGFRFEVRTAGFEVRTAAPRPEYERVYEQRKAARSFDDDLGYFEDRSSSRKHDHYGSGRKASRGYDERKSGRSEDDDRERIRVESERQRASDRGYQSERRRMREKERRRDTDEKYRRVSVLDDEDDSDRVAGYRYKSEEPVSSSRRRRDDDGGKSKDDGYRRERRRKNSHVEADGYEADSKLHSARQYIQRSALAEDSPVRPSPHRSSTSTYYVRPSVTPVVAVEETVRRSSARRSSERDHRGSEQRHRPGRKDSSREPISIVEPPEIVEVRSPRGAPHLPHSTSSPSALRSAMAAAGHPRRSETFDYPRSSRAEMGPLPRSSTMPTGVSGSSRSRDPLKRGSSKLKGEYPADSGYSSPGTPDSPPMGSRGSPKEAEYIVIEEEDAYSPHTGGGSRHHGAFVESDETESDDDCRVRSVSPPPQRRSHGSGRAPLFGEVYDSSKRTPVGRSSSYVYVDDGSPAPRRGGLRKESIQGPPRGGPSLLRTGSGFTTRGGAPPSFGRSESHRGKAIYDEVQYTPRYGKDDVQYSAAGARRGSFGDDTGYAYREHHFVHGPHPGLMRAETSR